MGASLRRARVPRAFGGKAGSYVDANHVFPQVVLAAFTLVGSVAGDGGARACAQFEVGLPLCSLAVIVLAGAGSDP